MRTSRGQRYWAVARDVISFVLGTFIILDQEITQRVNLELLLVALTLLGTPGAIALVQLFRGSVPPGNTIAPSQQSPVEPSPPQPSSASSS